LEILLNYGVEEGQFLYDDFCKIELHLLNFLQKWY